MEVTGVRDLCELTLLSRWHLLTFLTLPILPWLQAAPPAQAAARGKAAKSKGKAAEAVAVAPDTAAGASAAAGAGPPADVSEEVARFACKLLAGCCKAAPALLAPCLQDLARMILRGHRCAFGEVSAWSLV